jgi:hypothetical protein
VSVLIRYSKDLYIDPVKLTAVTVEPPVVKLHFAGLDNPILLHAASVGASCEEVAAKIMKQVNEVTE